MPSLLELRNVEARYGPVRALHGVSLEVGEGEVVAVLGANGAGKTTTLRAVSGTVKRSGEILFGGRSIARTPEGVARRGIAHVPEGRGTFAELSVRDNLRLGAYATRNGDFARVHGYFPWLEERAGQQAGTLSGGEQQMLAISRGLMADPKLLMIDEASLGLAPVIVQQVLEVVREINADGVTVILNEQNVGSLRLADKAFVIQKGVLVYSGSASELRDSKEMRREYLGVG